MKKAPNGAFQSVDKVYTLIEAERNEGRFGVFTLVGVDYYGRGENTPKGNDVGLFSPTVFLYENKHQYSFCILQSFVIAVIPSLSSV